MGQKIKLHREPDLRPKHQAFAFQAEAVEAVRDLEYAAIFHEQGLGKTKIAIDLMLYWLEKKAVDTILFVVKKGLIDNWKRELGAHTSLVPRVVSQNRRSNYYALNSPARVLLTHYEAVKSEKERFLLFLRTRNVAVILDESSKIKNPNSSLTKVFFEIGPLFTKRVIMTGTPVANRPYDLWAQIYFLDRGSCLGNNFAAFRRGLDLSVELSGNNEAQIDFENRLLDVRDKISEFSVRETKKNGIIKLPKKTIRSVSTDWEERQLELYKCVRDEMRVVVLRDGLPTEDNAESILKRLLRLVQIASNPKLIDQSYSNQPGKLEPLKDLIGKIHAKNEKCIIWTTFTENVDWLSLELGDYGCCKISGKLPMERRTIAINRFMDNPKYSILVATPGAAKEGLTLTIANHAIFFDRSFSLDDYLQAQDRIHRVSQERVCVITNLLMRNSIDEWIDILLYNKRLAAQLAQGDISREFYTSQIEYDFSDILRQMLNIGRNN